MKISHNLIYAFSIPVVFPEGLSIGSSGKDNFIGMERNGQGLPVLRGTSIAGIFRHLSEEKFENLSDFFGMALDRGNERIESQTVFFDSVFTDTTDVSMHNLICRHTGSIAADKGLFSIERVAPGAKCRIQFYFHCDKDEEDQGKSYTEFLIGQIQNGLFLGGNQARGTGRAVVDGPVFFMQTFDADKKEELAAFLDQLYSEKDWTLKDSVPAISNPTHSALKLELTLGIPRGQDLLCSEGSDVYPVSCPCSDGVTRWKIPGSSFRGVFRGWISRLAARDGAKLADSAENYKAAAGMKVTELHERQEVKDDPVLDLFGSLHKKGRLHITDAYSCQQKDLKNIQFRTHVAIDSFSGGTNPGRLFQNYVLTDPSGDLCFRMQIMIRKPEQRDIDWLEKTLQAMQLGIIRFGSSKASGRLAIQKVKVLDIPENMQFQFNEKGA